MAGWAYDYTLADIAHIYVHTDIMDNFQVDIEGASLTCPDLDDVAMYPLLDKLPAAFAATANVTNDAPTINLRHTSAEACSTMLAAILEARVFATPSPLTLGHFRICPPDSMGFTLGYTIADILSAPQSIGEGDLCAALTTAQRVDWVLRGTWDRKWRFVDERRCDYLRGLQDSARQMGGAGAVGLPAGP
ncbi:hypothetical protein PsYK624_123720 [Phanerochaete sordida]|uniref:Uncharacterized protein n=1 Tax=Phanerochaete sordida TaxID=48140 RepID=A0A9P3GKZ0_9APHY|nr:hypothetical protein PsYK624_123720 [Phanerochaete sordida]